jgi:hypothetical protein
MFESLGIAVLIIGGLAILFAGFWLLVIASEEGDPGIWAATIALWIVIMTVVVHAIRSAG